MCRYQWGDDWLIADKKMYVHMYFVITYLLITKMPSKKCMALKFILFGLVLTMPVIIIVVTFLRAASCY